MLYKVVIILASVLFFDLTRYFYWNYCFNTVLFKKENKSRP